MHVIVNKHVVGRSHDQFTSDKMVYYKWIEKTELLLILPISDLYRKKVFWTSTVTKVGFCGTRF